ncbi:hypothetical protein HGRIS_005002 [Hohenbuehelia grisea]|uniref:DUF7330 domain-containing protein n=1 Tax=Hohenbuehelia grisea TaxID=104357 RepID=A0ABR3JEH7_9AGAR
MIIDHTQRLSRKIMYRDSVLPPPPYDPSLPALPAAGTDNVDVNTAFYQLPGPSSFSVRTPAPPSETSAPSTAVQSEESLHGTHPEVPTVNHIHKSLASTAITGTYFIDPCLPASVPEEKRSKLDASFRCRTGRIALNLATVCPHTDHAKARVAVQTQTSAIIVSLLEMPIVQNISLDLTSKSGDISLLVPRSFCGVIQLRTSKGSVEFLPALAATMRVLKETDEEILILLGNSKTISASSGADFCHLASRMGKLTVGLKGEDKVQLPRPTFWKRLGKQLRGEKIGMIESIS